MIGALEAQITAVIREVLQIDVPSADTDLIAAGYLDSLAIVTLIAEIEDVTGRELPLDDLDMEHFRTVARMAAFVAAGIVDQGAV